jgi:hypothetical protein
LTARGAERPIASSAAAAQNACISAPGRSACRIEAIEQAIAKADAEAEKRDPELRKDRLIRKLQLDKEILADRESTQSPD